MGRAHLSAAVFVALSFACSAQGQQSCESLTALQLSDTTITASSSIPAGEFKFPAVPLLSPGVSMQLPAYCKVTGVIKPAADSNIGFQVWLPKADWNGRFMQVGNGGFAGAIVPIFLVQALADGYAVAATDGGHQGQGLEWASGHPDRFKDFADRAVHVTSEKSKEIVKAFYGLQQKYSYFNGCSEGGREALMEAQRYADDFDGILAGDPGISFSQLFLAGLWNAQAFKANPDSRVPLAKLKLVQSASIAACDAQDGATDGILSRPDLCHFDPHVLLCRSSGAEDCLTTAQADALAKVYAGPVNPRTGVRIDFGIEPGFESNMEMFEKDSATPGLDVQFFRTAIFADPSWDPKTINFDTDVALTHEKGSLLDATSPDLAKFKAHGGKLILYHGWNDPGVPPLTTLKYYEDIQKEMGGAKATDSFAQLYMVPGMFHCWGGPGPNSFGNILTSPQEHRSASNDIQQSMVRWVEQGKAPKSILATKFQDDDSSKAVLLTRPLCPYPEISQWNGKGSTSDAANFSCLKSSATPHDKLLPKSP